MPPNRFTSSATYMCNNNNNNDAYVTSESGMQPPHPLLQSLKIICPDLCMRLGCLQNSFQSSAKTMRPHVISTAGNGSNRNRKFTIYLLFTRFLSRVKPCTLLVRVAPRGWPVHVDIRKSGYRFMANLGYPWRSHRRSDCVPSRRPEYNVSDFSARWNPSTDGSCLFNVGPRVVCWWPADARLILSLYANDRFDAVASRARTGQFRRIIYHMLH